METAMERDLLLSGLPGRSNGPAILRLDFWRPLWRIGLIALAIIFALSTQFLFQAGLYEIWPLADILRGWLDHFLDLMIVGGCIFVAVAVAASLHIRTSFGGHLTLLAPIALGAVSGEMLDALRLSLPLDASTFGVVLAKAARWFAVGGLADRKSTRLNSSHVSEY